MRGRRRSPDPRGARAGSTGYPSGGVHRPAGAAAGEGRNCVAAVSQLYRPESLGIVRDRLESRL